MTVDPRLILAPIQTHRVFGSPARFDPERRAFVHDPTKGAKFSSSWAGCLTKFLGLRNIERYPERVVRNIMNRYGRLGFCDHEPGEAEGVRLLPAMLARECPICRKRPLYETAEPLSAWIQCTAQAHAAIRIVEACRQGLAVDAADISTLHLRRGPAMTAQAGLEAIDPAAYPWRNVVGFLNTWLLAGRIEYGAVTTGGRASPRIDLVSRTLMGNLALQLAARLTSAGIRDPHSRTYNYPCSVDGCRKEVIWRRPMKSWEGPRCHEHQQAHRVERQRDRDQAAAAARKA